MKWKLFDTINRGQRVQIMHWPYKYDFRKCQYKTTVIPLAIIFAYGIAFYSSLKDVHILLVDSQGDRNDTSK